MIDRESRPRNHALRSFAKDFAVQVIRPGYAAAGGSISSRAADGAACRPRPIGAGAHDVRGDCRDAHRGARRACPCDRVAERVAGRLNREEQSGDRQKNEEETGRNPEQSEREVH